MVGRAVHFAVTEFELARLLKAAGDDAAVRAIVEALEDEWERDWLVETDKAWEPIHRSLTGGTFLYGDSVAHRCVLGDGGIHEGDAFIIVPLRPREVAEVAAFIGSIDEAALRRGYAEIDAAEYLEWCDEDFQYAWENFVDLRAFFVKAAAHGRATVFSVYQ